MTAEILQFKPREPDEKQGWTVVWQCNCGNKTFYQLESGAIECDECGVATFDHRRGD